MTADELTALTALARRCMAVYESGPSNPEPTVVTLARGFLALTAPDPAPDERAIARLADPLTARYERIKAEFAQAGHDRRAVEMREPYAAPRPVIDQTDTLSVCPPPAFDGSTWAGEPRRAGRANERITNSGDASP